jgi:hypothetical protein
VKVRKYCLKEDFFEINELNISLIKNYLMMDFLLTCVVVRKSGFGAVAFGPAPLRGMLQVRGMGPMDQALYGTNKFL